MTKGSKSMNNRIITQSISSPAPLPLPCCPVASWERRVEWRLRSPGRAPRPWCPPRRWWASSLSSYRVCGPPHHQPVETLPNHFLPHFLEWTSAEARTQHLYSDKRVMLVEGCFDWNASPLRVLKWPHGVYKDQFPFLMMELIMSLDNKVHQIVFSAEW